MLCVCLCAQGLLLIHTCKEQPFKTRPHKQLGLHYQHVPPPTTKHIYIYICIYKKLHNRHVIGQKFSTEKCLKISDFWYGKKVYKINDFCIFEKSLIKDFY